jgi:hypothetical protein
MSKSGMQISARAVSDILASIIGPSYYDDPKFGRGDPGILRFGGSVSGRVLERGSEVMINPQPLPPRAIYAMTLADAHIREILSLHAAGALLGGEASQRAMDQSLRLLADLEDLCPRWPKFPRIWPPPPPPPFQLGDEMTQTELFLFGTRFLAAAGLVRNENLEGSLAKLGEKALTLGMQS